MQDLEITWPDGKTRFSASDSPIRLGRSSEAAIPLTQGSVSRRHLELVWAGSGWAVSDNSTHGTYDKDGQRLAPQWTVADNTVIRLGGVEGVEVEINLIAAEASPGVSNGSGSASVGGSMLSDQRGTLVGSAPSEPERRAASLFADLEPDLDGPDGSPDRLFGDSSAPAGGPLFDRSARAEAGSPFENPEALLDNGDGVFGGDGRVFNEAPPLRDFGAESSGGQAPDGLAPPRADQPSQPPPPLADSPPPQDTPPPPALPSTEEPAAGQPAATPPPPSGPPGSSGGGLLERDPLVEGKAPRYGGPMDSGPNPLDLDARNSSGPPGATGGLPAVRLSPNTTIISDAALRLNLDGQDYSFVPGAEVTVGRDPGCLVRVDERHSLVSRKHLRITHRDNSWWIEDFSSKGTFIDNRRIKGPYKAEGAFLVNMGDDDAGTPMRIITAGEHRISGRFNPVVVGALAAITLLPLAILAILLAGRSDDTTTEPDFASAKRSTVMLFGLEGGQGTGFFVDDNLIVTNQHVAVLSPQMLVAVSRQTDEPAEIEYATELVANHPFLDIAVLRISNRATLVNGVPEISSEPVGNINLPSVSIGDSDDVTIGDEVFSLGFPDRLSITSTDDMGDLRLPPVAATSGEAASFTIWPGCSNPDFETFIPEDSPPGVACSAGGDVDKGVLRATFSSGQGASGSAVFHNNEVVAVVYAGDAGDPNKSLNVSTAAFAEWLDEIIDTNP